MDSKQYRIFQAILIASFIIGCIITYFIISLMRHHKKIMALQRENAMAEITALEKDRARIAADLHDDLSPMLAAVKMKINSFELEDPSDEEELANTNSTIDDIISRMRSISFNLMPNSLQRKGLAIALKEFISMIHLSEKLKIGLLLPNAPLNLSESQAINTYRIIQEVIHNTIKHAHASDLSICLKAEEQTLYLSTADNGIGFNHTASYKNGHGLGLRSLANRVNLLNGKLSVKSTAGEGTSYIFEIPLSPGQVVS